MLSCSIWFYALSIWMDGSSESLHVGRVYGVDGAVQLTLYAQPTQQLSGPPPIQKLGAKNYIL